MPWPPNLCRATVFFEIGNQVWGSNRAGVGGGALGADGANAIKVKRAYIDWMVPQTDLKFRMGIQGVTLPNKAGGSAIMDTDAARHHRLLSVQRKCRPDRPVGASGQRQLYRWQG
mgnify:CR=1 FL=1